MQNTRHSFLGIMIICTVSIIFCLVSTFLLYQTKEKVSTAYKHPYTVSNTAREIHSRALDTKFFYRKLLSSETSDKKKLALIIHERFLKMNMDRDKIKKSIWGLKKIQKGFSMPRTPSTMPCWKGFPIPLHTRKRRSFPILMPMWSPPISSLRIRSKRLSLFPTARCVNSQGSLPLPSTWRRPVPFSSSSLS